MCESIIFGFSICGFIYTLYIGIYMYSLNVCCQYDHLPVITTMIPIVYHLCTGVLSRCDVRSHWALWNSDEQNDKKKKAAILYIHDFSPSSVGFRRSSLECFKLALKLWVCQHSILFFVSVKLSHPFFFPPSSHSTRTMFVSISLGCLNLCFHLPLNRTVCFFLLCSSMWRLMRRGYFDRRGARRLSTRFRGVFCRGIHQRNTWKMGPDGSKEQEKLQEWLLENLTKN